MRSFDKALVVGLTTLFVTPLYIQAGVITGNLLSNPGAETGNLSGWTTGGTSNPGVDNGSFDPGINPFSGSFDFYGGTGVSGSLSQTFSIVGGSVTAGLIDSGNLLADVSFWEQGLNQGDTSDNAYIQLAFLNASGGTIGSVSTPVVDSHLGSWTNFSGDYGVPVGTRSITYSMEFVRAVGSDLDSFVDDNSLTISGPAASTPEPSTLLTFSLGLFACGLLLRRRSGTRSSH